MHIFLFTTVPEFEWWLSVDCEFRVRDLVVTGYGLGAAEGDPVAPGGGRLRDALEASVVMRVGAPAGRGAWMRRHPWWRRGRTWQGPWRR